MKNFYPILLVLLFLAVQLRAQAPNQINYQGVARDASGVVLPNQAISLRFTIHQGSAGGSAVYQETQSVTTNLLGLFTVAIGSGVPVTGTFATIAWGDNTEYLQVEMDPTGGASYLDMGTNQFLSVPYALNAANANSSSSSWNLTGNTTGAYTFGASPTTYIGTTVSGGTGFQFGVAGTNAGRVESVSSGSTALGYQTLNSATAAAQSTAMGYQALKSNTGSANTAVGYLAFGNPASNAGNNNTGIGVQALLNNTGTSNTGVGSGALNGSLTGNQNTGIGRFSLGSVTTGANNSGLGYNTSISPGTLSNATAIGANAQVTVSNALVLGAINGTNTSVVNTSVGIGTTAPARALEIGGNIASFSTIRMDALATGGNFITTPSAATDKIMYADVNGDVRTITPGANNSILTLNASGIPTWSTTATLASDWQLAGNATAAYTFSASPASYFGTNASGGTGFQFGLVGANAGRVESPNFGNTALGYQSLNTETAPGGNTAIGYQALKTNAAGTFNTAVGYTAMGSGSGNNNTGIGYQSLLSNTGTGNTGVGSGALNGSLSGGKNSAIGQFSLGAVTTGTLNTGLGYNANVSVGTLTNATAVGANAQVTANNSLVLGAINGINTSVVNTSVGIGTTAPARELEIGGNIAAFSTIRMDALATGGNFITTPSAATDKIMYADVNGDVRTITPGGNNSILTLNASGVPTWSTTAVVPSWQLAGNAVAYSFNAAPVNYLGTTSAGGAGFQFGIKGVNAGSVESTNGNTSLGYQALNANSGTFNTIMGYQTGSSALSSAAQYNTAIGTQSFVSPGTSTGSYNIAIGYQALNTTVWGNNVNTASNNIAVGNQALTSVSTSHDEIAIGNSAGAAITTGAQNVAIGYVSMYNTGGNDNNNTVIGYDALSGNGVNVNNNTVVGTNAMQNGASSDNVAIGFNSMEENFSTSTGFNVAIGSGTLQIGNAVSNSTAIGYNALHTATAGNNTAVGFSSLVSNLTGTSNTALGYQAGFTSVAGNANVSGSGNTYIGFNAGPGTSTQYANSSAIGANAVVSQNNSLVLGSISGVNGATSGTSVGIGTATPNSSFQVNGSFSTAFVAKTGAYLLSAADDIVTGNATAGAFIITLPTASGIQGRQYTIKKTDASGNAVTIGSTSSQTIDGVTTYVLAAQWKYITVVSDGANWVIVGNN